METLDRQKHQALKKKPVHLSKETGNAIEHMSQLYKAGKVFVENDCAVRREADVYLAACKLADCLGKDLAAHLGNVATGDTQYTIIYNMQVQFKVSVGPHKCAVGTYDFGEKVCRYEGLVSC